MPSNSRLLAVTKESSRSGCGYPYCMSSPAKIDVNVRLSPKFWPFLVGGALLGVLAALIVTLGFNSTTDEFTDQSIFGYFAIILGMIGAGLGSIIYLILDRVLARKSTRLTAVEIDEN